MPATDGHSSHYEMQPSDSEELEELSEEEPLHQQDQEEIPEGEDEELDGDDGEQPGQESRATLPPPPPPGLKEISPLASWTVSSHKPLCGIPALRHPSTTQFWQSDGPQPHHLNIHFFKLVEIVGMRIYLDFDLDESYTPTLIKFFAGMGSQGLVEWGEMRFEQPRGWMEVDFEGVGEMASEIGETDENERDEDEGMDLDSEEEKENSLRKMPVLRCMLVQVRICENHQNGKDTHLRGLQIFARDGVRREKPASGMKTVRREEKAVPGLGMANGGRRKKKVWDIDMPEWSMTPELR